MSLFEELKGKAIAIIDTEFDLQNIKSTYRVRGTLDYLTQDDLIAGIRDHDIKFLFLKSKITN
jgi:hypothetical protein